MYERVKEKDKERLWRPLPPFLVSFGPRRHDVGGGGCVRRKEGSDSDLCVPRLVKFLDFGFHFRHEGVERALASYKERGGITISDCDKAAKAIPEATNDAIVGQGTGRGLSTVGSNRRV